jgi:hypothetical protein
VKRASRAQNSPDLADDSVRVRQAAERYSRTVNDEVEVVIQKGESSEITNPKISIEALVLKASPLKGNRTRAGVNARYLKSLTRCEPEVVCRPASDF